MKKKLLMIIMIATLVLSAGCGKNINKFTEDAAKEEVGKNQSVSNESGNSQESIDENPTEAQDHDENPAKTQDSDESAENSSAENSEESDVLLAPKTLEKSNSFTIDGYTFTFSSDEYQVLTYDVTDTEGNEIGSYVQLQLSDEEYCQAKASLYEWEEEILENYRSSWEKQAQTHQPADILEVIYKLTGRELSAEDRQIAIKFLSFIQCRLAIVPEFLSVDWYNFMPFHFSLTDVDKNGIKELLVQKGGGCCALYSVDGLWNPSLITSDIFEINLDRGILVTKTGDMAVEKTFFKYDSDRLDVLEQYYFEIDFENEDYNTLYYYRIESDGSMVDSTEKEFSRKRYSEIEVSSLPILWIPLNPANMLDYFFNVK